MEQLPVDLEQDLFGFTAPSEEELKSISSWASKALELRAEIEQAEEHLSGLNSQLREIEERNLPDALLRAGLIEFTLKNGGKISIRDVIQGGFPKDTDKREFTMQWIINGGGQELIKDFFEINYPKGQHEDAVALRRLLQQYQIPFDEFESVHTGQFHAFLKEKLESGETIPFEEMGQRFFKKADIKVPKSK